VSYSIEAHYRQVAKAMVLEGRVVPLLGAGVNLCGRPENEGWGHGTSYLPSGSELARHLADFFDYPEAGRDLVRVSQYVSVVLGDAPLYDELHEVFAAEYTPTPLHVFLASVPALVTRQDSPPHDRYQLVVTTNYDDALERAFEAAGEEYDLVSYVADGDDRGKFRHRPPGDESVVIDRPNEYAELSLERRTVILKIHGAIDRADRDRDSYVITEDDYIDYLTRTDISGLVPMTLAAKLKTSHILFLGYTASGRSGSAGTSPGRFSAARSRSSRRSGSGAASTSSTSDSRSTSPSSTVRPARLTPARPPRDRSRVRRYALALQGSELLRGARRTFLLRARARDVDHRREPRRFAADAALRRERGRKELAPARRRRPEPTRARPPGDA
jgi:hypothetical protein